VAAPALTPEVAASAPAPEVAASPSPLLPETSEGTTISLTIKYP
jgi:hypothetical protein